MIKGMEVIVTSDIIEFEEEVNRRIREKAVKDIKFCVNGIYYYAMVLYKE